MNTEHKELILQMINFCEENWVSFSSRYEENTGEELEEISTTNLRNIIEDDLI